MIQDDASAIEPMLKQLKKEFYTKKSRSIEFRRQQLQSLLRGLNEMNDELYEAFKKVQFQEKLNSKFTFEFMQLKVTLGHIQHDIDTIYKYSKKRTVDTNLLAGPGKSYIVPEPLGVVLVIGAWNYPVYTCVPQAATAIAAGNAVILKPSELSPNVSNLLAKLFKNYLDQSLYRVIEGGIEVSKAITRQPFDLIIFTGGTEKGKLVAKAAAENLVPCILELGGKSPCIVDGSGDLPMAVRRIIQTKFFNFGQTCVAPDYILMDESIKDQFLPLMTSTIKQFLTEKAKDSDFLCRMINVFHAKRVHEMIGGSKGEILYTGEHDLDNKFVHPTIIYKPSLDSQVMKEEIFGPILPIVPYKTQDEVIDFVNARPKPLALYYYGTNQQYKERIINETSAGGVCVNDCIFHGINPELPFGGVGDSGYGAYNGQIGFDQCSHLKPVLEKSTFDGFPNTARYPPYDNGKIKIMNFLLAKGNLFQGDLIKMLGGTGLLLLLFICYSFGLFSCCSGTHQESQMDL